MAERFITPILPDQFYKLTRQRELNYDDGTAGATTELHLMDVGSDSRVKAEVDVLTAFNGSTPSVDMLAYDTSGNLLGTIMAAATVAITTAANAKVGYFWFTCDAQIVLSYQRPASGSTAGKAICVLDVTSDPSADSKLGGPVLT